MTVLAWGAAFDPALPVSEELPESVVAVISGQVAADSQAEEFIIDNSGISHGPNLALRGDVLAEPLEPVAVADGVVSVSLCVSSALENAVKGPDASAFPLSDLYQRFDVTVELFDDGWLLTGIDTGAEGAESCVPPSVEDELLDDWDHYIDAFVEYRLDTSNEAAREELAQWVSSEDSLALGQFDYVAVFEGILVDPVIESVGRTEAELTWCQVPSLNPDSGIFRSDSDGEPFPRVVLESTWATDSPEASWVQRRLDSLTEARQDQVPKLWRRCHEF